MVSSTCGPRVSSEFDRRSEGMLVSRSRHDAAQQGRLVAVSGRVQPSWLRFAVRVFARFPRGAAPRLRPTVLQPNLRHLRLTSRETPLKRNDLRRRRQQCRVLKRLAVQRTALRCGREARIVAEGKSRSALSSTEGVQSCRRRMGRPRTGRRTRDDVVTWLIVGPLSFTPCPK